MQMAAAGSANDRDATRRDARQGLALPPRSLCVALLVALAATAFSISSRSIESAFAVAAEPANASTVSTPAAEPAVRPQARLP